jgi:hypothetical protein
MIDIGLDEDAERDIFLTSFSFMHAASPNETTVSLYSALDGSYRGKEISISGWQLLSTNNISSGKSPKFAQITIDPPIQLRVGSERTAFYLFASDEILLFGQGAYSIQSDHGVELVSSRAVAGLFGDGVDGFGLSCSIGYVLNDSLSTSAPTGYPLTESTIEDESVVGKNGVQAPGRDSLSFQNSTTDAESEHAIDESIKVNSAGIVKYFSLDVLIILTSSILTIIKL